MPNKSYERKPKEKIPVLAICYDFDKTLSPDDMQAQGYIQSVGYNPKDFWKETNSCAEKNDMDNNLSWMYHMIYFAEGKVVVNKENLRTYGSKVQLFDGVETWFDRINEFGKSHNVKVEHYVISSGLKEMIEGTKIANVFEKIYASSFFYNERGAAKWPAQVVNYTNKTQFLFRIEKGVLDINDSGVNDYFSPEKVRIPFRNIVYIGDSDTDIPCMKLVNSLGGHSIGVYNPETGDKEKVYNMIDTHRIKYFAPANYSDGSKLDKLVKNIILKTKENEKLEDQFIRCQNEAKQQLKKKLEEEQEQENRKNQLIYSLMTSHSFAMTYTIIYQLWAINDWSEKQIEMLCSAIRNPQVRILITEDNEVRAFFSKIVAGTTATSYFIKKIRRFLAMRT